MIDSHCHLDHEPLFNDLENILKRSKEVGIEKLLTICTTFESFIKIKQLVKKDDIIFGTYGIHPHEAKNDKVTKELIIDEINANEKIIGIGETGLDFYYNFSDKKDQIKCFEEHITASQKTQLPLIVHTRNAEADTLEILKKRLIEKDFKILIHCFTGSEEFAFKLIDLGAYISASGVVTFKKSYDLANTFKEIPNERILVETDSPYLAPVPLRGKPNEPSYIIHTVKFLSKLKNISFEDFSKITTKNFFKLFGELT